MKNPTYLNLSAGYTFVELLVVIGILATLGGITTINLLNSKRTASLSASVDQLVSDIQIQQLKTMTGNTEGRGATDNYGVYFGSTFYTLFHGTSYNAADTANYTVNLGDQIRFSNIGFSTSQVIFAKGTGEVISYVNGANSVSLLDTGSKNQTTLQLNTLGVITQVQ